MDYVQQAQSEQSGDSVNCFTFLSHNFALWLMTYFAMMCLVDGDVLEIIRQLFPAVSTHAQLICRQVVGFPVRPRSRLACLANLLR